MVLAPALSKLAELAAAPAPRANNIAIVRHLSIPFLCSQYWLKPWSLAAIGVLYGSLCGHMNGNASHESLLFAARAVWHVDVAAT